MSLHSACSVATVNCIPPSSNNVDEKLDVIIRGMEVSLVNTGKLWNNEWKCWNDLGCDWILKAACF